MPVNILPSCSKEVLLVKIESSHSDEWLLFLFFITCHTTLYPINIHYLCSSKSYKSETEVISVEGLSVEFNATPLFEDVSYVINKKDLRKEEIQLSIQNRHTYRYFLNVSVPYSIPDVHNNPS